MPRTSKDLIIPIDPELEKTLRSLRKARRETNMGDNLEHNRRLGEQEEDRQERGLDNGRPRPRRSIREASQTNERYEAQRNMSPQLQTDFEIKGPLFNGLPKFHGLASENPHTHLNNLYLHCRTMKPLAPSIEDVMWKVFHLTLEGKALEWYTHLGTYERTAYLSWENLRRSFLNKYFPEAKASAAKQTISSVEQRDSETLLEYLTRYQDLLVKCPNHQYTEEQLVEYFCNGLLDDEANHIDAASNGSITKLDVETAWELIHEVAFKRENRRRRTRAVKEIVATDSDPMIGKLAADMDMLTVAVKEINAKLATPPKTLALMTASCSVCDSREHVSRDCPHQNEEVSAMYYQGPSQFPRRDQQYNNRFRPGVGTGNNFHNQHFNNPAPPRQNPSSTETDTQLLIRKLEESEARTAKKFEDLGNKIDHLFREVDLVKGGHNELKASVVQMENFCALVNKVSAPSSSKAINAISVRDNEPIGNPTLATLEPVGNTLEELEPEEELMDTEENDHADFRAIIEQHPRYAQFFFGFNYKKETPTVNQLETKVEDLPFPSSHVMTKDQLEEKKDKELIDLFGKLEVNTSLLDLVRKVPRYTKVLKYLVDRKRITQKKLKLSPTISALLEPRLPTKRKDPGSFTIPCMIGKAIINGALLDLGASINVMPKTVYDSLNIKRLKDTGLILQLADKSSRRP